MARIEQEVIGECEHALGQRAVQGPRQLLGRLVPMRVQVGAPRIADEQGVAGENHPRLVSAPVVRDQVGVMGGGVARRRQGLDHRVAELDQLPVGERAMLELDPGARGQIGAGTGALDELRQAGDVIGLDVRLEHGGDLRPLRLGRRDVVIDQIDVRVDDAEDAMGLAAQEVRGACRVVVEVLAEEHTTTVGQPLGVS